MAFGARVKLSDSVASELSVSLGSQPPIGKLRVVQFEDESLLAPVGEGNFYAGDATATEPTDYTVRQGFCEASNVSVVEELVDLITVTRLYEANLKSITAQDDRMKEILGVATA